MESKYNFLEFEFVHYKNENPLLYLIIQEQYETIRRAFFNLDDNERAILDYFILNENHSNKFEMSVDLEKYIKILKKEYMNLYG